MRNTSGEERPGAARRVWTIGLICLGLACFFALQNVVRYVVRGDSIRWLDVVVRELLYWTPWALLAPLLLWLVRRFRLATGVWPRHIWIHALAAALVSAVQVAAYFGLQLLVFAVLLSGPPVELRKLDAEMTVGFPLLLFTAYWKYWVFVGVFYAFDYSRKYQERKLVASRLEARLATAELQALQSQLRPHFLFNTLHTISMLNLSDGDAANRTLTRLADLLRLTLAPGRPQQIPLCEELELPQKYLEIERLRCGGRLRVEEEIEAEAAYALVPSLILQPLVENAVRHGIAPRSSAGLLRIRARRAGSRLLLGVEDDGPGLPADWSLEKNGRVGLTNTAQRLAALDGSDHAFDLRAAEGGGLRVLIELPFETGGGTSARSHTEAAGGKSACSHAETARGTSARSSTEAAARRPRSS